MLLEHADDLVDELIHGHRGRIPELRIHIFQRAIHGGRGEQFDEVVDRLANRLEAADNDVYALQERARLLHEEIDSKLSSETNRHLYILSLMTAFLLPPSLVTGFFGMNTSSLPFAEGIGGTAYALTAIVLSILAAWWLLRRAGIL